MYELWEIIQQLFQSVDYSVTVSIGAGILTYVLSGWALYVIAKRRGLEKPWLAWIPVANAWALGAVSDHYRWQVKGQTKNRRKWLLILRIADYVVAVFWIVVALCAYLYLILVVWGGYMDAAGGYYYDYEATASSTGVGLLAVLAVFLLLAIPALVISVAYSVFYWIAIWDVLHSCEGKHPRLFFWVGLIGSILVFSGLELVFLFACMERDEGMIPMPRPQSEEET